MSSFPNDSAIKVQPGSSLEKEIASASSVSEIQEILHRAAVSQHLIEPDPLDRDGKDYFNYKPVVAGTAPRGYAKTLVVDGQKIIVESDSPEGLVQEELKAMRQIFEGAPAATTDATRDERGRFVAQPTQEQIDAEAARVAELASVNPMHRIEAELVERALANQGISIATLREVEGLRFQNSWAEATAEFLRTAGADWPGGENMNVAAQLIAENGLDDKPSAETLALIWNHMKANNLVVENSAVAAAEARDKAIQDARTPDELRAAVGYKDPSSSGGFWGR